MSLQIKLLLRFTPQRQATIRRKVCTVSAAQPDATAERPHASANSAYKRVAVRGRRSYACDAAYGRAFARARDHPEQFWGQMGRRIQWFEPWSKTLHVEDPVFPNCLVFVLDGFAARVRFGRVNVKDAAALSLWLPEQQNPDTICSTCLLPFTHRHSCRTSGLICAAGRVNTNSYHPKRHIVTFVGGKLNMCYNAVDRHVESGRGEQPAIIHDSPVTGVKQVVTFRELQDQVSKLAGVLVRNGLRTGDLVIIYMPMVPQAMFTMLACARLGVTHSLIFGGFASKELSVRINHAKPKLIVTASFGIEPGRRVEYVPLVREAIELSSYRPLKVLIYNRPDMEKVSLNPEISLDWDEEMATAQPHDCVPVPSNHPLYVLYTSGTTGTPKGVVRDTAGYAVMLKWTMSNIYGLSPGDVWWAASDLGWVVGHSYICYGPLLHGNSTVLYEGKPVGTPDPGAFFRVLSEHGVSSMFTAPTALRAIRQQDPHAEVGKKYPLLRLRTLFVAGERCDVATLEWAKKSFGVPVLDHWWQTETGSAITSTCVGLGGSLTPPVGQAGRPVPGYNVAVIDDDAREVNPRTLGNIVVRLPLPPGSALSLWQNKDLFRQLYFSKFPGYYDTMDAGFVDEEQFVYIMSRSDDVINVAGHRLSAGALEESVLQHPAVGECAVVGLEDALKGHVPLALCVLKNGVQQKEEILNEMVKLVRDTVGPVAAFRKVLFVKELPKTRSGKIPRSSLADLVNGRFYKISPTIEDPGVFKEIERQVKKAGIC